MFNKLFIAETIDEDEAAEMLGVSKITLQRARKRGEIACYRIGARVLYSPKHIQDYLSSVERKTQEVGEP